MELTKKILNISIAFSIVLLSLSVFIYSIKDSKATANPVGDAYGYSPVGAVLKNGTVYVVGYKYSAGQSNAKLLCSAPY